MAVTRRRLLGSAGLLGLTAACAGTDPSAPVPPVPIDGIDPLIDWIAAHPENASVLVDDGRGGVLEHLTDRPRPVASAGKVVHLTAYAQAVAAGRTDPAAPVPFAEWERWYVPGTDGGAHPAALVDAAAASGWTAPDLPCYAGESLLAPGPVPGGGERRAAALTIALAYADDPARRAAAAQRAQEAAARVAAAASDPSVAQAVAAEVPAQLAWWDGAPAGTVAQLAGAHRAAATDALGADVSAVARRHLERGLADRLPTGVRGAGQKGGSLPGTLSHAFTVRREDGTVGVSAVSLSGMAEQPWTEAMDCGALLRLGQQSVLDDTIRDRLGRAFEGR